MRSTPTYHKKLFLGRAGKQRSAFSLSGHFVDKHAHVSADHGQKPRDVKQPAAARCIPRAPGWRPLAAVARGAAPPRGEGAQRQGGRQGAHLLLARPGQQQSAGDSPGTSAPPPLARVRSTANRHHRSHRVFSLLLLTFILFFVVVSRGMDTMD